MAKFSKVVIKNRLFLVENPAAMAELREKQNRVGSLIKKVEDYRRTLCPDSDETVFAICIPDLNIIRSFQKLKKTDKVGCIFCIVRSKHLKRKPRDKCLRDFYLSVEKVVVQATDGSPLITELVPTSLDMLVGDIQQHILVMSRRVYRDEVIDDKKLQYRNQSKLQIIKTFDVSLQDNKKTPGSSNPNTYKSLNTAKIYEVFQVKRVDPSGQKTDFTLGIDYENIYIIPTATPQTPKSQHSTSPDMSPVSAASPISQKIITPSFAITCISDYESLDSKYMRIKVSRDGQPSAQETFLLESKSIPRIFNKLDTILHRMYNRPTRA